jgi:hypothetical protein
MSNYPSLKVIFYEHVEINVGQFGIKKEKQWGEYKNESLITIVCA